VATRGPAHKYPADAVLGAHTLRDQPLPQADERLRLAGSTIRYGYLHDLANGRHLGELEGVVAVRHPLDVLPLPG